jgi:subtilase family serine protease
VKNAALLHHLDPGQTLKATLAFNFRDQKAAEDYAVAASNPASPIYGQFLTPQEVGQRFGPMPEDYQAAKDFAATNKLLVTKEWPNRLTITVEGTVAQLEAAFGTKINEYREGQKDFLRRPKHGAAPMEFHANATPILVPARLSKVLSGVVGLQNYTRAIPRHRRAFRADTTGPLEPFQVQDAYNVTPMYSIGGDYGAGRTVGISSFDEENYKKWAPDFISAFSLPKPSGGAASNISAVSIDGGNGTSDGTEGDLDYQMVLAMAPLATIIIYNTGDSDLLGCYQTEANDNVADILTESYGWDISGSEASPYHNEQVTMAMQGQTYCCASGDDGSGLDPEYWPDIDPNILNVGGTELTVSGTTAPVTWVSEVAWNDPVGASTGGYDDSETYAQPSWQVGRGVGNSGWRQVPDIALEAGTGSDQTYALYAWCGDANGETEFDGTSCSSPMNAGALAVVEEYLISLGKLPISGSGLTVPRLGVVA